MPLTTTWDDIRRTVLQKMFLSNIGAVITSNDSTKDYLDAMPAAYNEAVMLVSVANRYITKTFEVPADGLTNVITVNLKNDVNDLFQLKPDGIYFSDANGNFSRYFGQKFIGDDLMLLDGTKNGTYRIYYYAYPKKATLDTIGTDDMQLDPDVATLIPLYMASELYKDDDIAVATQYRNEFEAGLEDLLKLRAGGATGEFVSETGWWG